MNVTLNGEVREIPEGQSLAELISSLGLDPARVAVELDRVIVRRPDWAATRLAAGAHLEVVHFVGGG
jgi:thiamine biosynthesis protein ThiS